MREGVGTAEGRSLDPYVPGVVVDWLLETPGERVREVDGTLVFADVSGFTPLSERLARKGKVGAEELTEILNRVFGRLLDRSYGLGGDLLKFGGDALLLLFTGDDHTARAAVAAADMQAELATLGRIDTGSGIVRLRMSVGLHSGPLLLFLVGESHRELLITGPGATETVRMEGAADAGEVLASAAASARLDDGWLAADKHGGRLLRLRRVAGAIAPTPFSRTVSTVAESGVPACLRDFLRDAPEDGEHRQATLAFLQFKGLDALLASHGEEAVADALDELVSLAQAAATRHDVTFLATDVDADGGKILFSTGAPVAAAHDDDRMLQALREILDAEPRLDIRAGVNRGHAFAVDVGAPYRRTFAVMGDPTNLAARVMGKAPMRGLLATTAVIDRLRTEFDLRELEPFMVKGKSHPIAAFEVGGARGTRRVAAHPAVAVTGREAEREVLALAAATMHAGRGSVVSIVGDAGLGKSTLVDEARRLAHARAEFVVEGGQYATLSPYFALRAPLRRLLGLTLTDADETVARALRQRCEEVSPGSLPWLPLIAVPFGVQLPDTAETAAVHPDFRRSKLDEKVTELLADLLTARTLVVVEDAHWLDDASGALLLRMVEGVASRPWLVCVTRRDEPRGFVPDPNDDDVTVLALEPLEEGAAQQLVVDALGDAPLPPDVVDRIVERSGGNPLYLQELVAAARDGRALDNLPDSIEPLIAARIDTLATSDRQLLREASVLGTRFPLALMQQLTGARADNVDETVDRLGGFLVRDGAAAARFRHALIREVAYESLPFRRRRALHLRAGQILEHGIADGGERPAALLSLHFHAAQDFERSWTYAREAADDARDRWAPVEAADLYRRAVDAARKLRTVADSDLAAVCFEWGKVAQRAGRYDDASSAYRSARRLWRDRPLELARLAVEEGWLQEHRGSYAEALRRYTKGQTVLRAARASKERAVVSARLLVSYGAVRLRQGRYLEGVPHVRRVVELAPDLGTTRAAKEVLAHAYYLLDWAYTDLGDPQADHWRELALPIYEELKDFHGQGGVLNNLGIDAYYEGRWREAVALYERARDALERSGDVMRVASTINNIGEVLSDQGHLDEAEVQFREAWRMWKSLDSRAAVACAINNIARVASRSGRLDEAAALYAEAAAEFEACGAQTWLLEVDARRAERAVFASEPDDAIAIVGPLKERAAKLGAPGVLLALVDRIAMWAHLQRGDVDLAASMVDTAIAVARSSGSTYELALTLLAAAEVNTSECDVVSLRDEASGLLADLGVVRLPAVPLPAALPA